MRVLIVDDAEAVQDELKKIYNQLGCEVAGTCSNGVEALTFLETERVDLVSLDIVMPVMDGIETYRNIRRKYPEVKLLLLSVLAGEARVVEAYQPEIDRSLFIPKNRPRAELLRSLRDSLGLEQPQQQMASPEHPDPSLQRGDSMHLLAAEGGQDVSKK